MVQSLCAITKIGGQKPITTVAAHKDSAMGAAEFVWIEVRQTESTREELCYHWSLLLTLVQRVRVAIVQALTRGSAYKQELILIGCPVIFLKIRL